MSKTRALVLLSGGLDSMLAAKVLMEQGIEVVGISFISTFFNAERAFEATKKLGIPLIAYNIAEKHLAMVKKPKYGYGKNINPCIDCHSMMVREAKEVMEGKEVVLIYPDHSVKANSDKYDFIATGEVLGQRPMSQTRSALGVVEKYSGAEDIIVRPLSAKLLEPTLPEREGKINRELLLDINGRSRSRQKELAEKFGITEYPSPAGGCLLTVPEFSKKLGSMFERWPECTNLEVELLKLGRFFWLNLKGEDILLVVGREEAENLKLEKMARFGGTLVQMPEVLGPVALLKRNKSAVVDYKQEINLEIPEKLDIEKLPKKFEEEQVFLKAVALIVGSYSSKARGQKVTVKFG